MAITYKTPDDIVALRIAGRLAADVLAMISEHVQAGVSTDDLDALCNDYIVNVQKAIPANVGYHGFPKTLCTSVNHVICHGIPSPAKVLKDGDIVNLDVTVIKDGWHGDTSRMYCVGTPGVWPNDWSIPPIEAMMRGIRRCARARRWATSAMRSRSTRRRPVFQVVREYCGHGIGKVYHEEPQVLHYGKPGTGVD